MFFLLEKVDHPLTLNHLSKKYLILYIFQWLSFFVTSASISIHQHQQVYVFKYFVSPSNTSSFLFLSKTPQNSKKHLKDYPPLPRSTPFTPVYATFRSCNVAVVGGFSWQRESRTAWRSRSKKKIWRRTLSSR